MKKLNLEILKEKVYFSIFKIATFFSVVILGFVLIYIISKGAAVVDWHFLTSLWQHNDITKGGIFQALIGTLMLGVGVAVFSIPIGIMSAIYLNEYARDTKLTRIIKLSIRNLAGVPSVIYGLFGLAFFVFFLGMKASVISASLTLGCMTLPWIITSAEEALKATPNSFREASLALGATKSQTIKEVVLPNSMSGILTGSILGISRSIGETAPIIIVGATFFLSYLSFSPTDKFMALPYHLFILATQHSHHKAQQYALGVALVLTTIIFTLNLGIWIYRYKIRKKQQW